MKRKKALKYIIFIVVLLIPIMYSFFYLKAYWDPYGNLQDVKIAMVNLDKGDNSENQGQKLVDAMVNNGTFNICKISSQEEANEGLVNGDYYAVITVPETFTKTLNSAQEKDKQISTVTYSPNQKSNYLASQIINSAIKTMELNLQSEVAEKVTDTLSGKLQDVPDNLQDISDGAGKIEDGTNEVTTGTQTLQEGTQELAQNYNTFDKGVQDAAEGGNSLDNGVGTLQNGTKSLITGVNTLATGTQSLDNGVTSLNAGAEAVNEGTQNVNEGANKLSVGANSLSTGAQGVTDGANELEGYLAQLNKGIQDTKLGYVDIDTGINEIVTSLTNLKTKMSQYTSQATQLATLKSSNETAVTTLENKNTTIKTSYTAYFSKYFGGKALSDITDAEIKQFGTTIATNYSSTLGQESATQIGTIYSTLVTTWRDTYLGNLKMIELTQANNQAVESILALLQSQDLQALISNETTQKLTALKQGSTKMSQTLETLESSIGKIYTGSKTLTTGTQSLAQGASDVLKGANDLSKGTNKLSSGTSNLYSGTNSLKQGSTQLLLGVNSLSNGGNTIALGIGTLKEGSWSLRTGLDTLAYSSTKVKNGISTLNEGTGTLNEGAVTLLEGTQTFKNKIDDGLTDTKEELTKLNGLSEFTKNPVEIEQKAYGEINQYGLSFTPLFLSIGLWVGALMAYVVLYYDQEKRYKLLGKYSENKLMQILLYLGIAIMQGIITGFLLQIGLGLTPTSIPLYYFTCVFVSIVFMSIIQFLIMNFGDIGKFLALVILVLQLAASGGTFPIQTVSDWFQWLNPLLPMTYTIKLVKEAVVSQDVGFATNNILILSMYVLIPLGITTVVQVIKKKREENMKVKDSKN